MRTAITYFSLILNVLVLGSMVFVLIQYQELRDSGSQNKETQSQISDLNKEIERLKSSQSQNTQYVDELVRIWEGQASQNDEMVKQITEFGRYRKAFIEDTLDQVLSVQGQSLSISSNADSTKYEASRDEFNQAYQDLQNSTSISTRYKQDSDQRIDEIYLELNQSRPNTAQSP